jgi:hypothetical protein
MSGPCEQHTTVNSSLSGQELLKSCVNSVGFKKSSTMNKKLDQRKYPRFQVRTGVGAAVGKTKIGTIANISRGGLALSCFDIMGEDEKGQRGSTELSIVHEEGFSLKKVPCKILGECSSTQNVFGSSINQCNIQFSELTPEQKSQIEKFLDQFTNKTLISQ